MRSPSLPCVSWRGLRVGIRVGAPARGAIPQVCQMRLMLGGEERAPGGCTVHMAPTVASVACSSSLTRHHPLMLVPFVMILYHWKVRSVYRKSRRGHQYCMVTCGSKGNHTGQRGPSSCAHCCKRFLQGCMPCPWTDFPCTCLRLRAPNVAGKWRTFDSCQGAGLITL